MRRLGFALASLAWMGLIYWASTPTGSTENTRPIVAVLIDWFQPGLSDRLGPDTLGKIDWVFRKVAHMTEYAILTGFLLGATAGQTGRRQTWVAWAVAVAYAASDEWHQSTVPGRYATVGDVGWDTVGATITACVHRWRSNKSPRIAG